MTDADRIALGAAAFARLEPLRRTGRPISHALVERVVREELRRYLAAQPS